MSAEYSVEEVLSAMDEAAYALEFLPGDDGIAAKIRLQKARAAFAKRIKADEGAHKPTPFAFYDSDRKTFFWFDDRVGAPVKTSGTVNLFTHPPAQAAQVERCEWCPVGKLGGTAEPVAQGEGDELIDAYDEAVRDQRESGFLPSLARAAARDRVAHNRDRLLKALAARTRAVPDGWVLVPLLATEEMLGAGRSAVMARECSSDRWGPADHYKAAGISREGIPSRLFDGKGKMSKAWGAELVYCAMLAAAPPATPHTTGAIGEKGNG